MFSVAPKLGRWCNLAGCTPFFGRPSIPLLACLSRTELHHLCIGRTIARLSEADTTVVAPSRSRRFREETRRFCIPHPVARLPVAGTAVGAVRDAGVHHPILPWCVQSRTLSSRYLTHNNSPVASCRHYSRLGALPANDVQFRPPRRVQSRSPSSWL